jgi:putative DNA primase/helicase
VTINLLTGQRYKAKPSDNCTKITTVRCDTSVKTPIFAAFLDRITDGDVDLQAYLKRVVGYCCTGHTFEHVLFFLYGTGANGKSVFINTVAAILGDYAATAPVELFLTTRNEQHPTALAHLQGARFVVATETDSGENWSEAKIKRLTGGDKIAARFMRGDFFEFTPNFKIMIAGNHVPNLSHVDEAFRRRLHLVPFTVTIPPDERDDRLVEKLRDEWPGILAWAIEGAREWRERGLQPPEAVTRATGEYFAAEDSFAQWLEDCCEQNGSDWEFERTADLYESYRRWGEKAGERAPTQKRFAMTMKERGYKPARDPKTRNKGFKGVRLRRPNYTEDPRSGD